MTKLERLAAAVVRAADDLERAYHKGSHEVLQRADVVIKRAVQAWRAEELRIVALKRAGARKRKAKAKA